MVARRRALVVEDDPMVGRVIARMLTQECSVEVAQRLGDALSALDLFEFDLVIVDLELGDPKRDGAWLLNEVRRRTPGARRVLISGHATELDEVGGPGVADIVLPKPFSAAALREAIAP